MTSIPSSRIERPSEGEYAPFYAGYLARVPETDILAALEEQSGIVRRIIESVPADKADYRYAPDKWTVRDVFGHVIDGERVFSYRMTAVSRGDSASLPGFDENAYVRAAHEALPGLADLAREFVAVRQSTIYAARRLDETTSARVGTANGTPVTPRAIAYIIVGHARHHLAVLEAKYGVR